MPASSERDARVRALLGAELVAGCSEGLTPAQPSLARKDRALPGGRGKGETPGTSRVVSRRTLWATPGWPRNEGGGNHPYRAALAPALRPPLLVGLLRCYQELTLLKGQGPSVRPRAVRVRARSNAPRCLGAGSIGVAVSRRRVL